MNITQALHHVTALRGSLIHRRIGHPLDGLPIGIARAFNRTMRGIAVGGGEPYQGPFTHATAPNNNTVSDVGGGVRLSSSSTSTTGGAPAVNNAGQLEFTSGSTDEDNSTLQFFTLPIRYSATKRIVMFARLKVSSAALTDLFIGLAANDTTPITTSAISVDDAIGFFKAATATDLTFHVRKNTTSTTQAAGLTIVSDAFMLVGFVVDQGTIRMFAVPDTNDRLLTLDTLLGNGTAVAITNVPDDIDILPTISVGSETAARTLTIDWAIFAVND